MVDAGYAQASEYSWNMHLVCCATLGLTVFACAAIGLLVLAFSFTGCATQNVFIGLATLNVTVFTTMQLFCTKPESGATRSCFLSTSVIAMFVVYLTYVAVSTSPSEMCNPMFSAPRNGPALIMGLFFTVAGLVATIHLSSATASEVQQHPDVRYQAKASGKSAEKSLLSDTAPAVIDDGGGSTAWKFNAVMALLSCFWCCVLTDWGLLAGLAFSMRQTAGTTIMWLNISASWSASLIYSWTLVAPLVFPDRDFS